MQCLDLYMTKAHDGGKDLFGHVGQAEMYKVYRPVYTQDIVDYVLSKVPENQRGLYVDVACGSGQLTRLISPFFSKSVGIDRSLEQLSQASDSKTEYMTGSAFKLPFADKSVDLLTVAQALHWLLPYETFFEEVQRVLKKGGVFVTIAYSFPQLVDQSANAITTRFYVDLLGARKSPGEPGCWWETNRPTIDGHYMDIDYPCSVDRAELPSIVCMSISHFVNYMRTFSAYRTYMESHTDDPLVAVENELKEVFGAVKEIQVINPFFAVSFSCT